MKRVLLFIALLIIIISSCTKEESEIPIDNKDSNNLLGYWELFSVGTKDDSYVDIENLSHLHVFITETHIYTSGIPLETKVIWPSGKYTFSVDGKSITRDDGIIMSFLNTGHGVDAFQVSFTIPEGTISTINKLPLDNQYSFAFRKRSYIDPSKDEGVYYRFNDFVIKYYKEKDKGAPGYPLEKCFEIMELPICGVVGSAAPPHKPDLFIEVWCKENPNFYLDHFNRRAISSLLDTIPGTFDPNNLLIKIKYLE